MANKTCFNAYLVGAVGGLYSNAAVSYLKLHIRYLRDGECALVAETFFHNSFAVKRNDSIAAAFFRNKNKNHGTYETDCRNSKKLLFFPFCSYFLLSFDDIHAAV